MTTFIPARTADREAATVFAGKVALLDPAGLVRMITVDDEVVLWARAGFGVLGAVTVAARIEPDPLTVFATDMVGALAVSTAQTIDPGADRGGEWRAQVPPADGWAQIGTIGPNRLAAETRRATAEATAAMEIERVGEWSAKTKATVPPRLLDSVCLTVPAGEVAVPVPMRMVLALSGMGFTAPSRDGNGDGGAVRVSVTRTWLRLDAAAGAVARRRMADVLLR